ncbi:transposon Tf2-1 polyprotein isoform X1 [Cucumis melo var. makuwa]|uniref:Transposon Tf2-1 polyprotein isoform X1 n=1 Tax=Cucumis melo var. makuwa TaxID=1194695 RepID=A0A5A7SUR4_CUCMM|nr:transposon Tf2-1 polyprotein isoform X1 [Cucumis melo var. makuwa]TYK03481.1 transposon Tf2-1 polyprotein isoform X1 [Cucumis melo var. makuwa]
MPVIESSLSDIVKNLELMRSQSEKQQQMLLLMMESMAKERSAVNKRMTESAMRESVSMKGKESKATSSKSAELNRNIGECQTERKSDIEEIAADRSKFKKVEMSVFIREDPDSWLFRGNKYFQIRSSTAIQGKGVCENVEIQLKNWSLKEDFLPLKLGGVDIILVLAIQRWRPYLLGAKFVVKTYQKSLKSLLEQRVVQSQYQKWVAKLLGYPFEVVYKPGLENKAVDALSRKPPVVQLCGISAPILLDLKIIKEEVEKDEKLQKVVNEWKNEDGEKNNRFSVKNGMLHYKNRLVLSKTSSLILAMLHAFRDSVVGGHSGFLRTYKRLTAELYWEGMKSNVKKHCEECLTCQRNKTLALSPAGLLVPLEVPQQVWSDISMDFVDGLPKARGFEVVLVVVDRLKKNFLSHLWKEMFRLAGTKLNKSTAYHPQSDGQTEFINRGLETYLRCFYSERPKEWVSWLPWAEFWYNTTFQRALGVSPFQVFYGRKPPPLLSYGEGDTSNSTLDEQLRERDIVLAALREHLILAQQQMKQYADRKRRHVEYQAQSEDILEYQKNKAGSWEVLIAWKGLPRHETSWEDYDEIRQLYPDLHLEDKVTLEGGSNIRPPIKFVYSRKK